MFKVQKFRSSKVQKFRSSEVQRFKGLKFISHALSLYDD